MGATENTIDHATLEHLVEAGAVRGASIIGQPGGWGVVAQYGRRNALLLPNAVRCEFSANLKPLWATSRTSEL